MKHFYRMLLLCCLLLTPFWVSAAPVDINTADAKTLDEAMQGVGAKKAQAIVANREKNGPFKSVDDLRRVKGISARIVDENRANLTVGAGKARIPAQ